jgi:hypothetical protein
LGIEELRAALRSAGTGVWEWDIESDRLLDADLAHAQLGYAPGTIEPTQQAWNSLIHPEDLAANDAAYQRHARGEAPLYEHRYRVRAADGQWRWFEERGQVVAWHADGRPRRMLGTQTDVTPQMSLHEAAASATERLERIPQHVPGVLFQFRREADGRAWFPYVSARCSDVLGLPPELLRGDAGAVLALIERGQRQEMLDSIAASARELIPWRLDFRVWRDGTARNLRGTASPQREAGGATLWHGYIEDVTELRALEQAQRAAEAAQAASRVRSEFLSRISHELRTPLNAVLGFSQLLEADPRDPPSAGQLRRLRLIRESGQHLLQMIGDLLDLSRAEAGGLALRIELVPLVPVAQDCVQMLQPAAAAAGVSLAVEVQGALALQADPTRLRQVLLNLLGNAIKYNRAGGRVDLRASRDGDWIRIEVHDTGIGIAAADLPLLFDPFWRGAQAQGRQDGAGIGLAIAHSLVQAMGGQIAVRSTPGAGSVFTVRLPAAPGGAGVPA